MTTAKSQDRFRAWLDERIQEELETVTENAGDTQSWGAGYDSGVVAGLKAVRTYFTGDKD